MLQVKNSMFCSDKLPAGRLLSWSSVYFFFFLPSACELKTMTEMVVDGWKGLLMSSSSLASAKEGERDGSSLSVTLAGRAGSRASMGAMMQWDSRHSGLTLRTNGQKKKEGGKKCFNKQIYTWALTQRAAFFTLWFKHKHEVHTFSKCGKAASSTLCLCG